MPVKTITAEINGQKRIIKADIPDGASEDDIMGAVQEFIGSRHGASGSWGGFTEGVKDAVTAPFKKENWKSLTDNPLVNPLRAQMETPDLLTPENMDKFNASNADTQRRIHLVQGGKLPFSPYEAGQATGNTLMAGSPQAFKAAWEAIPAKQALMLAPGDVPGPGFAARAKAAASAAGPDVGKGTAKIAGASAMGYAASQLPIPGAALTGLEIGPGMMAVRGGRQILKGVKSGIEEFRGPVSGPAAAPKGYKATPLDLSADSLMDEGRAAGERLSKMQSEKPPASADLSYKPLSRQSRPLTEDEIAFESSPKVLRPSTVPEIKPEVAPPQRIPIWKNLQSPKTPIPGAETAPVQSTAVHPSQSAAELLKTAGITLDAVQNATPEQWGLIESHVGSAVDRNAAIEQMLKMETPAEQAKRINSSRAKFNKNGQRNR